jgi:hypothetical protein
MNFGAVKTQYKLEAILYIHFIISKISLNYNNIHDFK